MYRLILAVLFVSLAVTSNATVYYVSASGSDSNSGTSPDRAWRSLAKVNSFTPSPGDQILFNRGDEWSGTITVNGSGTSGSPIVYGAYGTGDKPKIYGSEQITGWTLHSGNIYKATFNSTINQLFLDETKVKVARYPNSGYHYISSVSSSNSFTCNTLNAGINYSGAKWMGRTGAWTTQVIDVSGSSSNSITLSTAPRFDLNAGEGFFLMNKLEFLDSPGEWYYDSATKTVYVWTFSGNSPQNYSVRGSVHANGIYASNKDYVTIKDLDILQQAQKGIFLSHCDNVTIDNNTISWPDEYGIFDETYSQKYTISNNTVTGANHYGIHLRAEYSLITDNQVLKSALFDNLGLSGTGRDYYGGAVFIVGQENKIRYNRILESGYNGILFAQTNNIVEYNYVKDVCLIKGDGGGIYTAWANQSGPGNMGSVIRYNIVLNSVGPMDGYTANRAFGEGIYIDEISEGVTVENNTVAHCSNSGIFLHDNAYSEVKNNTVMDTRYGISISKDHGTNTIHSNIIYALDEDDYQPNQLMVSRYGNNSLFDNNKYINHYNSARIYLNQSSYYDFESWKSTLNQDANSTIDLSPLQTGEIEQLFYNDTKQAKTISLGSSTYRDINGNQVSGSITLQPFTSEILIKTTSGSNNNSPVISSQVFNIDGDLISGESVGQIIASDPDAGQILAYSITGGNEEGLFTIDSSTGELFASTNTTVTNDKTISLVVEVTDNAVEPLSASATITLNISGTGDITTPDVTAPSITSFTIPSNSASLSVPIYSFIVSDNQGVTGYFVAESATTPTPDATGWTTSVPSSYTFSNEGVGTLYAWAKDAAGNISTSLSASVTITLPDLSPTYSEYLFEEGAGTVVIDSKGSNDGTIVNEEVRVAGVAGDGLQFAGSGYVNLGQVFGENVQTEVTLSAWIQPSGLSAGYQGIIMHGGPNIDSYALYVNNSTKSIGFKTSGTTSDWYTIDNVNELWDGKWHQLAVTYDGAEKVIYLDGAVLARISAQGQIESGKGYNLLIGAGRDEADPTLLYEGLIDEVRIYNYALTSAAISDLYDLVNLNPETKYTTENIEICEGESYEGWTESGEYQRTIAAALGADSVVTTYLTVNPTYNITENITINEGESYMGWTEAGTYERLLATTTGCDSIVTTTLTVLNAMYTTENIEICEGESYEGWTESGEYQRTLAAASGADSVVTTFLTVNPTYNITENITINEGESYMGWTEAGTYERLLATTTGCDSIVTTILSVNKSISIFEEVEICEGEDYLGWTKSGEYTRVLKSASETDSIVTTYLTVHPVYQVSENIVITQGEDYLGWTSAGVYQRTLSTIYGCDSIITTNLEVKQPVTGHFETVWEGENGLNHMSIIVQSASQYGTQLQAGDEIAVFDGDKCVGAVALQAIIDPDDGNTYVQLKVSQDDGSGNGFIEGNPISYKIWDSSDKLERDITQVVYSSELSNWETSGTFRADATSVVDLSITENSQVIPLQKGWNIFSSYLNPLNPGMDDVQQILVESEQLFKVQDEAGETFERFNAKVGWINNIGDLVKTEGYKIRVKSDCVLEITGKQVSLPLNIALKNGWNIISFPRLLETNAMEVLQPLIDAGVFVKAQDETGNAIEFWDSFNDWMNGIGNFKPGEGYMLEVNADCVLPIKNDYLKSTIQLNPEPETVYFKPAFEGNGSNHMNINIVDLDETELQLGDEIAAFDGDMCVGAVKLTQTHLDNNAVSLIASLSDDDVLNGFTVGDSIDLLVWNEQTNQEAEVILSVFKGEITYQKNASTFGKLTSIDQKEDVDLLRIGIYPNPATEQINIRFSELPESGSRIILMDLNGKQLQSKEVMKTQEFFDIHSYPSGIYFIRTMVSGKVQVKKFVKN